MNYRITLGLAALLFTAGQTAPQAAVEQDQPRKKQPMQIERREFGRSTGGKTAKQRNKGQAEPMRFSTKYQEEEALLNYYGYRYYTPFTGRWLNRVAQKLDGGTYGPTNNRNKCKENVL